MDWAKTNTGVQNLLVNCAGAQDGQKLLIAYEPADLGYYDADILNDVTQGARAMGLSVTAVDVGFDRQNPKLSPDLIDLIADADIAIFLARLGDQLRFSDMPAGTTIVTCFAMNSWLLNSPFGTARYEAFLAIKSAVDRQVANAGEIRITCCGGTDIVGKPGLNNVSAEDTTLKRFPMSIFSPVPAEGFSGRVALCGFLTGTGSRYYDDYNLQFDGQIFAMLQSGRLMGFEGSAQDVAAANAQYDRVSELFQIDRNFVHSWHAGIHPGCGFPWDLHADFERWGGAAFGNPRILHFHTCGAYAPGEISWNMIDPTIEIDGLRIWENGRFHVDRLTVGKEILKTYPDVAATFADPDRRIGLLETS